VFDEISIGSGFDIRRLLDEPVKEFPAMPRPSTVEAERELIEVVVEMRGAHGALVRSQQPPFEQRHDQMDPRQHRALLFGMIGDKRDAMSVPVSLHAVVTEPAVGMDHAARLNDLVDKALQTVSRGIRHTAQANAANPVAALRAVYLDILRFRARVLAV